MLPKPEGMPKRLELREAGNAVKEKRGGSPQHGGGEIQESICGPRGRPAPVETGQKPLGNICYTEGN